MILTLALALVASWIGCYYSKRPRRRYIYDVEKGVIKVLTRNKVVFVSGVRVKEIDPVRFYDEYYETIRQYVHAIQRSAPNMVLEIRVIKKPVSVNEVVSKLEREITSLRVLKMSDPTDVKVDRKLKVLEKLYKVLSEGTVPTSLAALYLLYSPDLARLRSETQFLMTLLENLLGAKVELVGNKELRKLVNYNVLHEDTFIATAEALSLAPPFDKQSSVDGIYIGKESTTQEPVFIPKETLLKHVLVVGSTGSGKSTFLATLALRSQALYDVDLTIVDPKGDLYNMVNSVGIEGSIYRFLGDPQERRSEVNAFIREVVSTIVNSDPSNELRKVVIIDEAWLIEESLIEELVREGRSKGVAVVLASQSLSDFERVVRSNVHSVISFRINDPKERELICKMIGGNCDPIKSLPRGEALVRLERGNPMRVIIDAEEVLQASTLSTLKSSTPMFSNTSTTSSGFA